MPPPQQRHVSPRTVIVVIALFIFTSCSLSNRYFSRRFMSNEWDVLIFTQNWPVSVCLAWEQKSKENSCERTNSSNEWTIHGVWPTKLGTLGPYFCSHRAFSPESIYGIENDLEENWSRIEKHKRKYMFWAHEWSKHGTCAAQVPALSTEFSYFSQGLEWHKEYNMSNILTKAGIVPGKGYNVSTIWYNVKQTLGKSPHIACYTDSLTKINYLLEVRICFNKNLTLVDCDGTKMRFRTRWMFDDTPYTNCKLDKPVQYASAIPYPPPQPKILPPENLFINIMKTIQFLGWMTS